MLSTCVAESIYENSSFEHNPIVRQRMVGFQTIEFPFVRAFGLQNTPVAHPNLPRMRFCLLHLYISACRSMGCVVR